MVRVMVMVSNTDKASFDETQSNLTTSSTVFLAESRQWQKQKHLFDSSIDDASVHARELVVSNLLIPKCHRWRSE